MSNFKTWYKKSLNLKAGQLYTYNLKTESNIVQVFNKIASGGSTVFLDDTDKVSPTFFSVEVQQGKNASLVKPYVLETVYLYVESDVTVDVIEIQSDDLSFMFTASQVVDIQGSVQVQEPVTVDGVVSISGETEITNDSGAPIPVTGDGLKSSELNLDATNDLQVDVKTLPSEVPFTYMEVVAGATGDQTVKSSGGEVAQIISDQTAQVYLKDGANQVFPPSSGEVTFPNPVTCDTSIVLNFDVAGTAYIIYR